MGTNKSSPEPSARHLPETLLTSKETAGILGVPETTLDQWSYRGVGPDFIKVGRHRRYRPSALEAYLEANTRRAGGHAA